MRCCWVVGLLALGACRDERPATPPDFEVTHILPQRQSDGGSADPLYLNQEVTVRFSARVDPLSVTDDTVRMTDAQGRVVKGRLRVQSHSVTFEPVAPLDPGLGDGSFRPGQEYRLEVAGYPRAATVRSAAGGFLEAGVVRRFRALPAEHQPSPLLHTRVGPGFSLEEEMLEIAQDSQQLRLHFYEPPFPATVTPEAFELCYYQDGEAVQFRPRSAKLHRFAGSLTELPGWMVELDLGRYVSGSAFVVRLSGEPDAALRNYRGELPTRLVRGRDQEVRIEPAVGQWMVVDVHPGERVPLVREDFRRGTQLQPLRLGAVGFEAREGSAVPLYRSVAGTGELGVFMPAKSLELEPGRRFDRGDGTMVSTERPVFDFLDFVIPRGVRVVVRSRSDEPLQIRSVGRIEIEGELVFESTPWGQNLRTHEESPTYVSQVAGALLVAGGDVRIRGRVSHAPPGSQQRGRSSSPLTVLSGGSVGLYGGTLPERTYLAVEGDGRVRGETLGGLWRVVHVAPTFDELPAHAGWDAAAATRWYPIPRNRFGRIDVELGDLRGELDVQVQVALPDPSNPSRPGDAELVPVSLPLTEPLSVPPGAFVRFLLEARGSAGQPMPSVGSISVVGV